MRAALMIVAAPLTAFESACQRLLDAESALPAPVGTMKKRDVRMTATGTGEAVAEGGASTEAASGADAAVAFVQTMAGLGHVMLPVNVAPAPPAVIVITSPARAQGTVPPPPERMMLTDLASGEHATA